MKLALAGSDVTMDGGGGGGGGGATTTTLQPVGADVGVTAAAGATFSGDVFASTLAGLLSTKEDTTTTIETTQTSSSLSSRHAKAPPTMRRAIAKRKRLALDKALAHAERRGAKRDKKSLKRGNRVAARDVY